MDEDLSEMDRDTCEEVIDGVIEGYVKVFEEVLRAEMIAERERKKFIIEGDVFKDFIEWIRSYARDYSDDPYYRAKRLTLAWDCDEVTYYFLFFEDGRVEFHYKDWFDYASRVLEGRNEKIMNKVKERIGDLKEIKCKNVY